MRVQSLDLIVAAAAVCWFGGERQAEAQFVTPYTFGGTLGWPYGFYQRETIPYYSLHPPVYYSVPVARTYGYSPWAYPPGVMTPDVEPCLEPERIINPHVPQSSQRAPKSPETQRPRERNASFRKAIPQPKVIQNPFVTTARLTAAE